MGAGGAVPGSRRGGHVPPRGRGGLAPAHGAGDQVRVRILPGYAERLAADPRRADQPRPSTTRTVAPSSRTSATTRPRRVRWSSGASTPATTTPSPRCSPRRDSRAGRCDGGDVRDQRQPEGAFLDQFLAPFDRDELAPMQRVLLLARYLRLNGAVRLTGPSSQEPIDLGLRLLGSDRIIATPFQYSAVTALGASRLGVPARVVVGARAGERGIVLQTDVFSWVEVQLADGTWRALDPERYTGVHTRVEDESDERLGASAWVAGALAPSGVDGDDGRSGSRSPRAPRSTSLRTSCSRTSRTRGARQGWSLAVLVVLALLAWLAVPVAQGAASQAPAEPLRVWSERTSTGGRRCWTRRAIGAHPSPTAGPGSPRRPRSEPGRTWPGAPMLRSSHPAGPETGARTSGTAVWSCAASSSTPLTGATDGGPTSILRHWSRDGRAVAAPSPWSDDQVRHEDRRPRSEQTAGA